MNRQERIARDKALAHQKEQHFKLMHKTLGYIVQVPTCDFASKEDYEAAVSTIQFWQDKLRDMVTLAQTALNQIEKEKKNLIALKGIEPDVGHNQEF